MALEKAIRERVDVVAVILDVSLMVENSAVFQTQVRDQLLALQSLGLQTALIATVRDGNLFEEVAGKKLRDHGIRLELVQAAGLLWTIWRTSFAIRGLYRRCDLGCLYFRSLWGPIAAFLAKPLGKLEYVFDVRGDIADEMVAKGGSAWKKRAYLQMEGWGVRRAKEVTAVTRFLADLISYRHGRQEVIVIPSCVNAASRERTCEQIKQQRTLLGYSASDIVLVYSGGLSHYQQVPVMLRLWRELLLAENDLRFLLLTNDNPHANRSITGDLSCFGDRLQHMSLPAAEVPTMLAASDIGFMLRENRVLNQAASPVKFAEYLSAGLAVVASPGTGDASDVVVSHNVGVLVDPLDIEDGLNKIRKLVADLRQSANCYRRRAQAAAREIYDWSAHAPVFRRLYGRRNAELPKCRAG